MVASLEQKLAAVGQLTTIIMLVSPFPNFVFCHKKSLDANKQVSAISSRYLFVNFMNNAVWLVYSLKIDNSDLIIINSLGSLISFFFLALYLYVKARVGRYAEHSGLLVVAPVPLLAWQYLSSDWTGLLATTLSISAYIVSLDSVSHTLKTRDAKTVNMGIVGASVINGLVWMMYAIIERDIYVLMPNIAALISSAIQLELWKWAKGDLDNTHWFIRWL